MARRDKARSSGSKLSGRVSVTIDPPWKHVLNNRPGDAVKGWQSRSGLDRVAGMGEQTSIAPLPLWRQLYVQVLAAIVTGGLIGHFAPDWGVAFKPLGDGFIKLVKLVVAPLVFVTIVTGIAHLRDMARVGRVAGRSLAYFFAVSTLALVIGLIVANVVQPGAGLNIDPASLDAGSVATYVKKAGEGGIVPFLLGIIPDSILSPFTDGNMLQVLFLAISLGTALALVGAPAEPLLTWLGAAQTGRFRLTTLFMAMAPIGAFGAFAFTIGKFGLGAIANLALLIACFYGTAILFVVIVLGTIARAAGFSIFTLLAYLKTELLLDYAEWVLDLGAVVCLCRLDQRGSVGCLDRLALAYIEEEDGRTRIESFNAR
jgi:aerobic C4-dicarboxylate transport protein